MQMWTRSIDFFSTDNSQLFHPFTEDNVLFLLQFLRSLAIRNYGRSLFHWRGHWHGKCAGWAIRRGRPTFEESHEGNFGVEPRQQLLFRAVFRSFLPILSIKNNFVEEIWDAVCASVRQIIDAGGQGQKSPMVAGIGFCATCSLVVLDSAGNPLPVSQSEEEPAAEGKNVRNVILWMDHRAEVGSGFWREWKHLKIVNGLLFNISNGMDLNK
jgi:hypothetical protein